MKKPTMSRIIPKLLKRDPEAAPRCTASDSFFRVAAWSA